MKKILLILVAVIFVVSFYGCDKTCKLSPRAGYTIVGTGEDCYYLPDNGSDGGGGNGGGGTSTSGILKITNITSYPFKVYIDGVFKSTISGGSTYSYTDAPGYYSLKWEQTSGHYVYPLTQDASAYIYANSTTTINIPTVTTGKIKIVSTSNNPYTLYINGSNYGTISGEGSKTVEVDAWHSYNVRVLQQSGYVFTPSEYTWTINVDANYIYTRTYPTKGADSDKKITE